MQKYGGGGGDGGGGGGEGVHIAWELIFQLQLHIHFHIATYKMNYEKYNLEVCTKVNGRLWRENKFVYETEANMEA